MSGNLCISVKLHERIVRKAGWNVPCERTLVLDTIGGRQTETRYAIWRANGRHPVGVVGAHFVTD